MMFLCFKWWLPLQPLTQWPNRKRRQARPNSAYSQPSHHREAYPNPLLRFTSVLQYTAVQNDLLNWRWKLSWQITYRGSIWLPASGCPSVPPQLRSFPNHRAAELRTEQNWRLRYPTPAAQYAPKHTGPMANLSFVLCFYLFYFFHRSNRVGIISNKFSVRIIFHHFAIFLWLNYTAIWMKSGFIIILSFPEPPYMESLCVFWHCN